MPPPPPDTRDTLHGWKEIAEHLDCSVRSAQRWEVTNGLPVKRIPGPDGGPIVYASRAEAGDWQRQTLLQELQDDDDASTPATPSVVVRVGRPTLAVLVTLAAGLASGLWLGAWVVPA